MNHGDKDAISRRVELHREALTAEWSVPEGRLGSVIRQLRRRAMIASTRASALLFLMVLVVFAGLFYYVGQPIWQKHVDGRRAALEQLLERTAEEHNELTDDVMQRFSENGARHERLRNALDVLWNELASASDLPEGDKIPASDWVIERWDSALIVPRFGPPDPEEPDTAEEPEQPNPSGEPDVPEEIEEAEEVVSSVSLQVPPTEQEQVFLGFVIIHQNRPDFGEASGRPAIAVGEDDSWGDGFVAAVASGQHNVSWQDWVDSDAETQESASSFQYIDLQLQSILTHRILSQLLVNFEDIQIEIKRFVRSRGDLTARQDVLAEEYVRLDEDGYGLLDQERQMRDLTDFMEACRGNVELVGRAEEGDDTTPLADGEIFGAITTACAQAFQAQVLEENDNLWEILAIRVPPGFLLLFLLVTLGGLYRYSIRLASFHNSRADVLEMLSNGRGPDDPLNDGEWKNLRESAAAFAGDRVEFGAATAGIGPGGLSFGSTPNATKE